MIRVPSTQRNKRDMIPGLVGSSHGRPVDPRYSVASRSLTPRDLAVLAALFAVFWIATPFYVGASVSGQAMAERVSELGSILNETDAGSPVRRAAVLVLGMGGAMSLLRSRARALHWGSARGWALFGFGLLAVLSPAWSLNPVFTLQKAAGFVMLVLAAVALAERWDLDSLVRVATALVAAEVFAGILAELAYGTLRPFAATYRFRGVTHPNTMGTACAVLAVGALSLAARTHRWRAVYWGLAGFATVMLALTKSRGALAGFLVALTFLVIAHVRLRGRLVLACAVAAAAVAAAILVPESLAHVPSALALGRQDVAQSPTLSGRIGIWRVVLAFVSQRPWLGFGYQSFWTSTHILDVAQPLQWYAGSAHSGYLECLLSLGTVGLSVLLMSLLAGLSHSWSLQDEVRGPGALFSLLMLSCLLTNMLTEIVVFDRSIPSFLCMILLVRLGFGRETLASPRYRDAPPKHTACSAADL